MCLKYDIKRVIIVYFMCLKYSIKWTVIGLNVPDRNWDMYISPPSSESDKMYMWINLKDERVQLGSIWIWFLATLMVEHVSFFIDLALFCFALGWACWHAFGWVFLVLDWTYIIFVLLLVERVVVFLVERF